ncbi:lipopolysaccharide biosynthesis glycosyltransferase, putative [Vibrio cholerae]|uniref:glycosyltransferase family 2 protein n=1 Tax=Vibrio cholerae TaxID=666 RepID=UPI00084DAD81|nr:glycosyltransferase family 2 protein [Vibrio cholerae]EGQ9395289.1 glycosyltransferase family 2 protein [Vibrio cholerae]EHV2409923.1 glycosyltransferase family 2 protein [Vibrio cholerae]EHZ6902063.1 glycosyltransferase family 2 protein [Vibrio cholerae]EIE9612475.1 glycosyltransferase family 2 protein [Vibrio cholerae]EJK2103910.1 glycosyltransferase family 2 protein [Vibrio cholerae]
MNKPTLAVALIVKNEARHLDECLQTVHDWVDEIVVLDSGSHDETEQIARRYTEKFYVNAKWPGFGPQRQLAQSYVQSDYVLWLDADERVTPELKQSILQAVATNKPDTLYQFARLSWVFGRFIRHSGWYPDRVLRLYPTQLTRYNDALVHEKVHVEPSMKVETLAGDAIHYTYNDVHHYLVKSAGYAKAWADQRQAKGKKASLSQGIVHAVGCFLKMYLLKRGFLDGKQGFLIALLSAHSTFVKYADLWARDNDEHYKR